MRRVLPAMLSLLIILFTLSIPVSASTEGGAPENSGPYNASFMPGGVGIHRNLSHDTVFVQGDSPFHIVSWVKADNVQQGMVTLVALGDLPGCRCLGLIDGKPAFQLNGNIVVNGARIKPGQWTHLALSVNAGKANLYVNGRQVDSGRATSHTVSPDIAIAPVVEGQNHFGGTLVGARVAAGALDRKKVKALFTARPNFDVVHLWHVGVGWEWQHKANTGIWRPQDPWTLPQGKGAMSSPAVKPVAEQPVLTETSKHRWQLNGWRLISAAEVDSDGETLTQLSYDDSHWHRATVPGTVLTTLVDQGVYPDPYYGLNNLVIPEKLSRQNYWYRSTFAVKPEAAGMRYTLVFNGINYASEIWFNGKKLGNTRGAFERGQFEIRARAGDNVVAVNVSPPPHPGTPHEQSIKAGVGENGGQLAIDGPTFVATEGWDWIPGIRDRNTGIWLPVELRAHGDIRIQDPQVMTDLPLPRTDVADIHIVVPIENRSHATKSVKVTATFDQIELSQTVKAVPGITEVRFTPQAFPALKVSDPELWWPNGYGEAALHDLTLRVYDSAIVSDIHKTRFGIREVSYDLSLFDSQGELRRVNVQTTNGKLNGQKLIDVRHEAIKRSPKGWAQSLTSAGERSTAVSDITDTLPEPHLTIRVNGVKIAARGGNWGMDDAMKRSSRKRLEPYFRLQREAHMNIIRNWMGTNTDERFFDLADEYGMMVFNDFWQSTQNFQVEPQDSSLFLANARDTVSRYRNHPSIIAWFGRNEGVPYPAINEGLDDIVFELDGTRWYTGSSNVVNLQGSGPYNYRSPVGYFTNLASGFSVEVGAPSLSTLESIKATVPEQDLWPLSDTLAYHDWHFGGNGDTKTFMETQARMFGPATSLDDFERKSQMMNMETYKALFEGFFGHLWTKNSGRLLWMTHPAWPSNAWQIYSWDYDTHAAYYGAKKASEPLHIQINQPDNTLVVVNTTQKNRKAVTALVQVTDLSGHSLYNKNHPLNALANRTTVVANVPLQKIFTQNPMVLVSLRLQAIDGQWLSENTYWRGKDESAYRALNTMPKVRLAATAAAQQGSDKEQAVLVTLVNQSDTPSLNVKLTLVDAQGERILPAYYSDNYLVLLPGEEKTVTIRYPASSPSTPSITPSITLRGWNVMTDKVVVYE